MPFDEEHESSIEFLMTVHYTYEVTRVSLCEDLQKRGKTIAKYQDVRLTDKTYFSAGCRRSLSCSCATSSNKDGLSGSLPTSLKNSI